MDKTIDHRLAWLAGIIDGEGWIGLGLDRTAGDGHHKNDSARWVIEVCNTDYAILAEILAIADVLGVHARRFTERKQRFHQRKVQGRVSFRSRKSCEIVLTAVLPYLIGKRAQAELLLRAMNHRVRAIGRCPDRILGWMPAQEDRVFLSMMHEMSHMNRRGTAPIEEV